MKSLNTYKTFSAISINGKKYGYFDLKKIANLYNFDLKKVPFSSKILLENLLRNEDGISVTKRMISNFCKRITNNNNENSLEIFFYPTRVLMQDFTGVPAVVDLAAMRDALKKKNINPNKINPLIRVDLIIDHSVTVDHFGNENAFMNNVKKEYLRNNERYEFLKWGQKSFNNLFVVPPGSGICHQVNLENISKTIWTEKNNNIEFMFPDSVIGTDSHTTMVNSLSVLGWGVGGIEAESAMLGQPISINVPKIVGFKIEGSLKEGVTATDLVLTITEKLRSHGVVGKFVEFFGPSLANLTLADRATISNMAPEYGATCGYFPTDQETLKYLQLSGKEDQQIEVISTYTKAQNLWHYANQESHYDEIINFKLDDVSPSLSGPTRPQDRIALKNAPESFKKIFKKELKTKRLKNEILSGDVVIAAITSCTNTSNPNVMIAAGLVAKKASELGLKVKPWVKTSLAPGSKVVSDYLNQSGLSKYLNELGFSLVGYGCTTCIGNSGSLEKAISDQIKKNNLSVCSVLSGNRNFEGRIHQEVKGNYLASPPLVVAYALAGNININLEKDPIGIDKNNNHVFLKDLWPSSKNIQKIITNSLSKQMFLERYEEIYKGDENWENIKTSHNNTYEWNESSTYIKSPPFFDEEFTKFNDSIYEARILALLGDSVTTDHISPAGAIKYESPAGQYLYKRQINRENFNSYGSRRGNHEIMMRGTFANIRIRNEILPGVEGGITKSFVSLDDMPIYDAAVQYKSKNIPLVIIAGKEYGTGSSRDWAAKGTKLLGVQAVIAESFERIHRSNLIGMGVLPLEFMENDTKKSLNINGNEKITINDLDKLQPNQTIKCSIIGNDKNININLLCRIDTNKELDYFNSGGILNYVLNSIEKNNI